MDHRQPNSPNYTPSTYRSVSQIMDNYDNPAISPQYQHHQQQNQAENSFQTGNKPSRHTSIASSQASPHRRMQPTPLFSATQPQNPAYVRDPFEGGYSPSVQGSIHHSLSRTSTATSNHTWSSSDRVVDTPVPGAFPQEEPQHLIQEGNRSNNGSTSSASRQAAFNPIQEANRNTMWPAFTLRQPPQVPMQQMPETQQTWPIQGTRRAPQEILRLGVLSGPGPGREHERVERVQRLIQYAFKNPALLIEALESKDSGITFCGSGETQRQFLEGNRELAKLGEIVMGLMVREQLYTARIEKHQQGEILQKLIGWHNLATIGEASTIEQWVRTMRPMPRKRNPLKQFGYMIKDDLEREDPGRTIATAMRAIIGAVHLDGGTDAVKHVMEQLNLFMNKSRDK